MQQFVGVSFGSHDCAQHGQRWRPPPPFRVRLSARANSPSRVTRRTAALSALQDNKRRSCQGMDAESDAESCSTGFCCDLLDYFCKCRNCGENKRKSKVGCFSTCFVILFFYSAQKQLIARTTVSPSTSCRPPLLVFTVVLLLCLPSPELPGTGCGVVPRIGCGGYHRSFRFSSRTSSLFFFQGTLQLTATW